MRASTASVTSTGESCRCRKASPNAATERKLMPVASLSAGGVVIARSPVITLPPLFTAEIGRAHAVVGGQRSGRAGLDDMARLDHVAALRDAQRHARILFGE